MTLKLKINTALIIYLKYLSLASVFNSVLVKLFTLHYDRYAVGLQEAVKQQVVVDSK